MSQRCVKALLSSFEVRRRRDSRGEGGVEEPFEYVVGLHHVHVAVDEPVALLHLILPPRRCRRSVYNLFALQLGDLVSVEA